MTSVVGDATFDGRRRTQAAKYVPKPTRLLARRVWRIVERLSVAPPWKPVPINPAPTLIIGNQKSGTSAIAALLAAATGRSATIDLLGELVSPKLPLVRSGQMPFEGFIRHNAVDFSRDIVKDCHMTFFFDELSERFPESRSVFIVRDPRDNIRSILNRLELPGDQTGFPHQEWSKLGPGWKTVLDGRILGFANANLIEILAHRWMTMVDVYSKSAGRLVLVRYEDFVVDKSAYIRRLAGELGLEAPHEIHGIADRQYQPPGQRGVIWEEFFGADNLATINSVTQRGKDLLAYD